MSSNINKEKNEERLQHLFNTITNENYYTSDYFRVMNHEAASGKSIKTFEALAWLGLNTNYKVVYVQPFANEVSEDNDGKELKRTVKEINKYAKKNVANYLSLENSKEHSEIIKDFNIICITHNKYISYCESNKKDLISKADILIIDEFPSLYEEYQIGRKELEKLYSKALYGDKEKIEDIATYLRDYIEIAKKQFGNDMRIINLHKQRNKNRVNDLKKMMNSSKDEEFKRVCKACIELLSHSSIFEKGVFYTYNSKVKYKLAQKNNIILDANAGFDERYKVNKKLFQLDRQAKVFDYSNSIIILHSIKTTKTELNKLINIVDDVIVYTKDNLKYDKCLIVTDKDRDSKITSAQKSLHSGLNRIDFTYFGNFIGKNEWRKHDLVWTIKTPYYRFYQYILMYMFYSGRELNGNTSCELGNKKDENYIIFKNEEFDSFKNSIVAGEIYQGAKRIARDARDCNIHVLIDNTEIFDLVKKQFEGIKHRIDENLKLRKKETKAKVNKKLKQDKQRAILNKHLESGIEKIEKQKLADELGISPANLSRELKQLIKFLFDNNIEIGEGKNKEYIIFKNNIVCNAA